MWDVVESDPQFVFLCSEILPQEDITITYKIGDKIGFSDIVNRTFTEVYAEGTEEPLCNNNGICEPELGENENNCPGDCPISVICEPYTSRCVEDVLQLCNEFGTDWIDVDTCEFGCSDGECNPKPADTSYMLLLIAVVLAIAAVIIYTYISTRSKKKPGFVGSLKKLGLIGNAVKRISKGKKKPRLTRPQREKVIAEKLRRKISERVSRTKGKSRKLAKRKRK